ncbi:hypothetical protein ACFQU7_14935 [Pseudoroseomonas wenyumeiae]
MRDALAPQDGLYTVLTRGPGGDEARIIGSVLEALTVPEQPDLALARLADPATRVISLTVTEKAYCRDSSGALDERHPDIRHDLEGQGTPRSVHGLLAAALRRRVETGAGAVTLMTCDNLPDNGRTLERVLRRFVELRDPPWPAGWRRTCPSPPPWWTASSPPPPMPTVPPSPPWATRMPGPSWPSPFPNG